MQYSMKSTRVNNSSTTQSCKMYLCFSSDIVSVLSTIYSANSRIQLEFKLKKIAIGHNV